MMKGIFGVFLIALVFGSIAGCGGTTTQNDTATDLFNRYTKFLDNGKYTEAYKMLTFRHLPGKASEQAFEMAQKISFLNIEKRTWKVLSAQTRKGIVVLDIESISEYTNPKGSRVRQLSQVFIVNDDGWKIVPGMDKDRKRIFEVMPGIKDETLKLSPDRLFVWKDNQWDERTQINPAN